MASNKTKPSKAPEPSSAKPADPPTLAKERAKQATLVPAKPLPAKLESAKPLPAKSAIVKVEAAKTAKTESVPAPSTDVGEKALSKKQAIKQKREDLLSDTRKRQMPADPLSSQNLRKLGIRIGIPVVVVWVIVILVGNLIFGIVVGVLTAILAAFLYWAINVGRKRSKVVNLLQNAETKEGREEALKRLDTDFKKGDTAAVFAKAQLQMQDDPRAALKTLEAINLSKVMAQEADEARGQRAMIHLILGETDEARSLVDPIDLSRHKDAKGRASLTAIISEAWARSGQASRAVDLLEKIDPNDQTYSDLKPQLLRARAFAYAWANNTKQMKLTLHQMRSMNVQYLMGFITKKKNPMGVSPRGVHPLLEKEAYEMIMKSGMIQRKMEMRRG